MADRGLKTVSVIEADYEAFREDAKEFGDQKLQSMFGAYARGWKLLTPEQKFQAIRCAGDSQKVASPVGETPAHDIRTEVARLLTDSAELNSFINEALADGECNAGEKKRLRGILKQLLQRIDGTAQLAAC